MPALLCSAKGKKASAGVLGGRGRNRTMRTALKAAALGILLAAAATGCTHHTSTGGAAATASALATSPQVRTAEAKLKTCLVP
jgi:hypothetical protein